MKPKILTVIKNKEVTKKQIINDIIAGIIVAIIALPLSIALGISSGVSPEKGLITAIVAGFVISLLGGSRVQIGGPTGAFVVIVYTIVQTYGITGLITATMMAGVMLIIMGLFKLGSLIKYVPQTITVGFTSGIAVTLLCTQLKDLLGLNIENVPAEFIPKVSSYFTHISTLHFLTFAIGILCIGIIVLWPKINKTIPGSLVALVVSTLMVSLFNLPVDTIGSRFQQISSSIPVPTLPSMDLNTIKGLFQPAMTIAILAAIESLLSAVVADGMIEDKHDSNMELIAQGFGNIASALFGGIPATGAIARTAANVKNGGRSPISGMIHAVVLLLIMMIFMPLAKMIPMSALASVLVVVSYNMGEWSTFKGLLKAPKGDVVVLVLTFALTVIFDLVIAIEIGMVLSMFLFMKKVAEATNVQRLTKENELDNGSYDIVNRCKEKLVIYQVNGPLFFGVVHEFNRILKDLKPSTEALILDMDRVNILDASAMHSLKKFHKKCKKNNIRIFLTNLHDEPKKALENIGFMKELDKDSLFGSRKQCIAGAYEYIKNLEVV